jgi:hypothetical protein
VVPPPQLATSLAAIWNNLGTGDPPLDLSSSYGITGITGLFAVVIGVLWRADRQKETRLRADLLDRFDVERATWTQQRADLLARFDAQRGDLIARIDAAERLRDEAIKSRDRAAEEVAHLAQESQTRIAEVLERALATVNESGAQEKALREELERVRHENDRLSTELERRRP